MIWAAVLRHEAPYTLLAATLTPVGPVGSVIAIHYIEGKERRASRRVLLHFGGSARARKGVGGDREGGHAARPTAKNPFT